MALSENAYPNMCFLSLRERQRTPSRPPAHVWHLAWHWIERTQPQREPPTRPTWALPSGTGMFIRNPHSHREPPTTWLQPASVRISLSLSLSVARLETARSYVGSRRHTARLHSTSPICIAHIHIMIAGTRNIAVHMPLSQRTYPYSADTRSFAWNNPQ